jgi:hypothetical protein
MINKNNNINIYYIIMSFGLLGKFNIPEIVKIPEYVKIEDVDINKIVNEEVDIPKHITNAGETETTLDNIQKILSNYVELKKKSLENTQKIIDLKKSFSPNIMRDITKDLILPAASSAVGTGAGLVMGILLHKLNLDDEQKKSKV